MNYSKASRYIIAALVFSHTLPQGFLANGIGNTHSENVAEAAVYVNRIKVPKALVNSLSLIKSE